LSTFGFGGFLGMSFGGSLFKLFGIYGSLAILISILASILISTGSLNFSEIALWSKDVFVPSINKSLARLKYKVQKTWSHLSVDLSLLTGGAIQVGSSGEGKIISANKLFEGSGVENDLNFGLAREAFEGSFAEIKNGDSIKSFEDLVELELGEFGDFAGSEGPTSESFSLESQISNKTSQGVGAKRSKRSKKTSESSQGATEARANLQSSDRDADLSENKKANAKSKLKPDQNLAAKAQDSKISSLKLASESGQELNTEGSDSKSSEILQLRVKKWTGRYSAPDSSLLSKAKKFSGPSEKEIKEQCQDLESRLESFQIKGQVISANVGASLTMFEFLPAPGVKLSKIIGLTDDLALLLGASSIRILAPIPGKNTVGIEVPNKTPRELTFGEFVKTVKEKEKSMELPLALGLDVFNNVIVEDLTTMPHILVSGTTGSGKSVFINTLINSLLYTQSPKDLRFIMIDPKMIELNSYNSIPHLMMPVVTDTEQAKDVLVWAEKEMDRRYEQFRDIQARNIITFNEAIREGKKETAERKSKTKFEWDWTEMPYIVVIIDELADLMITQGRLVEVPITRIAQKARAAGIHLVLATQRPSAEIVTGLIKTNFPTRIAFKVSSSIDSRTILDTSGAEKLMGRGDMLFMPNGKSIQRLQGCFLSEGEVKKVVHSISSNKD
jgi:DNA segregation ATPase FtsK/SpoIIIE-like protein